MTNDPLPDRWATTDLPVLRELVLDFEDRDAFTVTAQAIADRLDLTERAVQHAFRRLEADGYIRYPPPESVAASFDDDEAMGVTPKALRETGVWPTPETALDRMIAALDAIAANTDDEDTRTNAQKFGAWLRAGATTVGLGVATAAINGQLPGT